MVQNISPVSGDAALGSALGGLKELPVARLSLQGPVPRLLDCCHDNGVALGQPRGGAGSTQTEGAEPEVRQSCLRRKISLGGRHLEGSSYLWCGSLF